MSSVLFKRNQTYLIKTSKMINRTADYNQLVVFKDSGITLKVQTLLNKTKRVCFFLILLHFIFS